MLRGNIHFKQLQHALDPKLQHPFEVSSKTLWVLGRNIHLKSFPRRSGVRLERQKVDRFERRKVDRLECRKVTRTDT